MLHVVDLNLMRASARHHPDGRPKDPHEAHRRDHILQRRLAQRLALLGLLRRVLLRLTGRQRATGLHPSKC
jgi:hypothetical protein